MLAEFQTRFTHALLHPEVPAPQGMNATARRFAVYRNNVVAALVGALETRFPVALKIVGEDFFRSMCATFVRSRPPRSPVLLAYGDELPEFVERFEPVDTVPYLADVMRLEIARSEAFHATDAPVATAVDLQAISPENLAQVRVRLHPSARLLSSAHPVATIAALNAPGANLRPIESWIGEDVLVTRPHLRVHTHILAKGGFAFLSSLRVGASLGSALVLTQEFVPEFDAASALAGLFAAGTVQQLNGG